jgi:hypothetical protein
MACLNILTGYATTQHGLMAAEGSAKRMLSSSGWENGRENILSPVKRFMKGRKYRYFHWQPVINNFIK